MKSVFINKLPYRTPQKSENPGMETARELMSSIIPASFSSLSFIFVSLSLPLDKALLIYLCHIIPSLIKAIIHKEDYKTYILRDGDVIEVVQFMGGGCGTSLMYRSIM